MTTYKQILAHLKALDTEELVTIYNDYASMNGYENVLDNDSDFIDSQYDSPYDAIRAAFYGDYNPCHEYVTFNGYGNLLSFCYIDDEHSPLDYKDIAKWIDREGNYHQYDINVITKDNKIDAIIDNINDIDSIENLHMMLDYIGVDYVSLYEWLTNEHQTEDGYFENYQSFVIELLDNDNTLNDLLDHFNIAL